MENSDQCVVEIIVEDFKAFGTIGKICITSPRIMEYWETLILAILAGALAVYYLLYTNVNFFEGKGVPYVKVMPFFGNMAPNVFRKLCYAENVQRLYNLMPNVKYMGIYDFMNPVVMLRDPELIKSVTTKNFESFVNHRNFMDEKLDPLFSKNLLLLESERWRETRALLSPAFTSSKMKAMFKLMSKCGDDFANHLATITSRPIEKEMKDIFTRYTNDVIATTAFGLTVNSLEERDNEFYRMGRRATTFEGIRSFKMLIMKISPFLARLLRLRAVETDVHNFFNNIVGSTIAMRDEKGIVRNDMIQLMMQSRDKADKIDLTTEDMTAQAFIFFFGGFDTSSTLMSFAAHEAAVNPAIQEKLQAEIDAVLAEGDGEVTYEALHNMQYLDAVINETLRLYPLFSAMDRVCNKAFELPPAAPGFAPFTVEVGTTVWLPCHGIQRDPQYFPDPEKFDPERFSEENKGSIPSSVYFPYGLGPRSCIGSRFGVMEAKLALFHLFSKYSLSPCSKTSIPIKFNRQIFPTTAENGYWLTIQRRS